MKNQAMTDRDGISMMTQLSLLSITGPHVVELYLPYGGGIFRRNRNVIRAIAIQARVMWSKVVSEIVIKINSDGLSMTRVFFLILSHLVKIIC
jgi:hypothetical protein